MDRKTRKNYTITVENSQVLARTTLSLSEELQKTVPRQLVLDCLVTLLGDVAVFKKVKAMVKKHE